MAGAPMSSDSFAGLGSAIASLMFLWAVLSKYFRLEEYFPKYTTKLVGLVNPYIKIKFQEFAGERFSRSEAYTSIESYLTTICSTTARKLKADIGKDSSQLSLSMDDQEEVTDTYQGVKVWWSSHIRHIRDQGFSFRPTSDEKRHYILTFHHRYRDLIHDSYLKHVMEEGKAAGVKKRQRKLYTNNASSGSSYSRLWSNVPFHHPATFETLAIDPDKKREIVQDLVNFSESKDYYHKIGKAWKRGYLLYGPPGTGKSSMVAAMANHLRYDVYDLELTAVKDNTTLRKLLFETTNKSIIVIEDIDCSIDLTGKRKKANKGKDSDKEKEPMMPPKEEAEGSKVTLSGLLNFIDGLWSACVGERLIVFTTNYIEKLDPALIRRGRMDKHIELSYCGFEAFKAFAKKYLDIESHPLFEKVRELIEEVKITPADMAETLMPKSRSGTAVEVTACLEALIEAMEMAKSKAAEEAEQEAATSKSVQEEELDEEVKEADEALQEVKS